MNILSSLYSALAVINHPAIRLYFREKYVLSIWRTHDRIRPISSSIWEILLLYIVITRSACSNALLDRWHSMCFILGCRDEPLFIFVWRLAPFRLPVLYARLQFGFEVGKFGHDFEHFLSQALGGPDADALFWVVLCMFRRLSHARIDFLYCHAQGLEFLGQGR